MTRFEIIAAKLASTVAAVTLAAASGSAQASELVNGSFEDPTLAPWTAAGGVSAGLTGGGLVPDGTRAAILGFDTSFGSSQGTLSQTFTAASAGIYQLKFWLGRTEIFCGCNDVALTFRALFDSAEVANVMPAGLSSHPAQITYTAYEGQTFLAAGQHTLTFEMSRGGSSFGRAPGFGLDGVSVAPLVVSAGVPEPATWATMLLGFGAIGFAARRRRKRLLAEPA